MGLGQRKSKGGKGGHRTKNKEYKKGHATKNRYVCMVQSESQRLPDDHEEARVIGASQRSPDDSTHSRTCPAFFERRITAVADV